MFTTTAFALLLWLLSVAIYRLYLHPLSKIPGPKLAAITSLYEFYFDVMKDGMFIWELERLHKEYGPIVRINPHEVHINDKSYYNEIYTGGPSKREKYWSYVRGIGLPESVVSTLDHKHHSARRGYLSNFFSLGAIRSIEPMIYDKANTLVEQMKQARKEKKVVNLSVLFYALTTDLISHYAYGTNYNVLIQEGNEKELKESLLAVAAGFHLTRFLPIDITLLQKIPLSILGMVFPPAARIMTAKKRIRAQAIEALGTTEIPDKETIFTVLMKSDLPAAERTVDRVQDESFLLLQAGSETTSQALGVLVFYILRDKVILERLKAELRDLLPLPTSRPSLTELQASPYLRAVINEGFRLSFGTLTRLPRVSPIDDLKYKDWVIPAGTPMSQSAYLIHTDPDLFPNPHSFDPDRWIKAGENQKQLESMLVNFSKGRRSCLGINLANAGIYITLAYLIRWVDMTLLDTRLESVTPYRDRLVVIPKSGAYNVQVRVNSIHQASTD